MWRESSISQSHAIPINPEQNINKKEQQTTGVVRAVAALKQGAGRLEMTLHIWGNQASSC